VNSQTQFRIRKGQTLFEDEEDSVSVYIVQREDGSGWRDVLELSLESGRSWGDRIDQLYRHLREPKLLLHIEGFGYWGDYEFYESLDDGLTWNPIPLHREPNPDDYSKEELSEI
jgi:hypothetical protein